jgi:hypothetical protein
MSETLNEERPQFLKVLCILTFIGSGLGLLGGLLGMIGVGALGSFAPQGTIIVQLLAFAASGLCLFGALQMWSLKKQGFTMYVGGIVIGLTSQIVSYVTIDSYVGKLGVAGDLVKSSAMMGMVLGFAVSAAFVIMYNANKKHLIH